MGSNTWDRRSAIAVAVAAAAAVTAGCAPDGPPLPDLTGASELVADPSTDTTPGVQRPASNTTFDASARGGAGTLVRAMAPFDDCDAFLGHVRDEAAARVGPWGLEGLGYHWGDEDTTDAATDFDMAEEPADEPAEAPAGGVDAQVAGTVAGTNVQEAGVDEADIVKTDGDRLLVVDGNQLHHVDITDVEPRLTDTIELGGGWQHELFLGDDRALVIGNGAAFLYEPPQSEDAQDDGDDGVAHDQQSPPITDQWLTAVELTEIDLSDPTDLRVLSTLRIEGTYLSARQVGDTVRVALSTSPQELPWVQPAGTAGESLAAETNRDIVDRSTLADWTPSYELTVHEPTTGVATTSGELIRCDRLNRPADFSGFEVVSVVDVAIGVGLADGFDPDDAVGVLAAGNTVYSSLDRFYVATNRWLGVDQFAVDEVVGGQVDEAATSIHAFEFAADEPARYVASGSVDGRLLNQFSFDEHDGYLRVLTTTGSTWNADMQSETVLTVLDEQGDRLVAVGQVGGLGKGEQLYSARLLGDVGFAVTFRQIDPFYVLDLSDPTAPQVTGELKIPGFSTYLHPLDDDRVLGVGQAATDQGQTTGLKVSIFDVSDPARPAETAQWTVPGSWSAAEHDHRAFQIVDSTVLLPAYDSGARRHGVVALDVSDGITELGWIAPDADTDRPAPDGCTAIDPSQLPDNSGLFPIAQEASMYLCQTDVAIAEVCDGIMIEDAPSWGLDEDEMRAAFEQIGGDEGDWVSWCWPDDRGDEMGRIVVVDDVVYTISPYSIHATSLDGFEPLGSTSLY